MTAPTLTTRDKRLLAKYSTAHYLLTRFDSKTADRLKAAGLIHREGIFKGRYIAYKFTSLGRHLAFQAWFEMQKG